MKRNAIITGCSGGIGKEILKAFVGAGINVWALVHSESELFNEECRRIEKDYDVWIHPVSIELNDPVSIKKAVQIVFSEKESIDILVNNAGVSVEKPLSTTTMDEMVDVLSTNFVGPSLLTQVVSRRMIVKRRGTIINIASRAGIEARFGAYAYGASKAAVIWSTKALAKELGEYGITVNAVVPGLSDTPMGINNKSQDQIDDYLSDNCIKRIVDPSEVASLVLYLASEKAALISGQMISVDGGRLL